MMDTGINRIATKQDQCHNCKKFGHFAKDCWQGRGRSQRGQRGNRTYHKVDHANIICDYCKSRGHLKKQCRKKMRDEQYRGSGASYHRGKRGNGRGGFNQHKHGRRGVRTIQNEYDEEEEEDQTQEEQSFLDNGEELQQRN